MLKLTGPNLILHSKIQFIDPKAFTKDDQATGEASSPQKRTSDTENTSLTSFFLLFCGSFLPTWILIRLPNADPDLADQNQSGSGSTTQP
jgi:hypothetical protein